jgi:hypothetical protein
MHRAGAISEKMVEKSQRGSALFETGGAKQKNSLFLILFHYKGGQDEVKNFNSLLHLIFSTTT